MSRVVNPIDNGYTERFVGLFKLAVTERRAYHTLGALLRAVETWIHFYHTTRPHEGLGNISPLQTVIYPLIINSYNKASQIFKKGPCSGIMMHTTFVFYRRL